MPNPLNLSLPLSEQPDVIKNNAVQRVYTILFDAKLSQGKKGKHGLIKKEMLLDHIDNFITEVGGSEGEPYLKALVYELLYPADILWTKEPLSTSYEAVLGKVRLLELILTNAYSLMAQKESQS